MLKLAAFQRQAPCRQPAGRLTGNLHPSIWMPVCREHTHTPTMYIRRPRLSAQLAQSAVQQHCVQKISHSTFCKPCEGALTSYVPSASSMQCTLGHVACLQGTSGCTRCFSFGSRPVTLKSSHITTQSMFDYQACACVPIANDTTSGAQLATTLWPHECWHLSPLGGEWLPLSGNSAVLDPVAVV